MKLFGKKDKEEQQRPVNPNNLFAVRVLAVGYLLYCVWQIVKMYIEGGEDAPAWWLVLIALVVLGGGAVWIAITSFKQWRRLTREQQEAAAAEAALEETEEADICEDSDASEEDQLPEEN